MTTYTPNIKQCMQYNSINFHMTLFIQADVCNDAIQNPLWRQGDTSFHGDANNPKRHMRRSHTPHPARVCKASELKRGKLTRISLELRSKRSGSVATARKPHSSKFSIHLHGACMPSPETTHFERFNALSPWLRTKVFLLVTHQVVFLNWAHIAFPT